MNWLIKLINDLIARKFYGQVIVSLEAGKITIVKKVETLKPE